MRELRRFLRKKTLKGDLSFATERQKALGEGSETNDSLDSFAKTWHKKDLGKIDTRFFANGRFRNNLAQTLAWGKILIKF